MNLTLNRDKELDESADEYADEVEDIKPLHSFPSQKSKKAPQRSRSVLGCDQMGIETLVSMINSTESGRWSVNAAATTTTTTDD